ncbi:MAG: hypothetical protein ACR2GL_05865 [Thermoleophilaceae bacterium]
MEGSTTPDGEAGNPPDAGFLPPEPGGPEPDLGPAPPASHPAPGPATPPPQYQGYAPPPGSQGHPPQTHPPPPGYGPQHGYGQSAGYQQQPQQPPPPQPGWAAPGTPAWGAGQAPWAYAPAPAVPDNGSAVAGLVLSITAGGLLLLSAGLSSIVSIVCAALGIFYSRRGRARVDRGETPKHRGVAQAGFITGIVTLVLSILATAFWLLLVILYATDDEFQRDFDRELQTTGGPSPGLEAAVRVGAVAVRLIASAVA